MIHHNLLYVNPQNPHCHHCCNRWRLKGNEARYREIMLEFLNRQPGKKIAAKTLAEVAGIAQNHAIRLLSRMVDSGGCNSELMDASKPNSNRNPIAYFVKIPDGL